jgi:GNAT superfamily N-acetyltransferase
LRTLIEEYDDPTPEAASSRYAVLGAIAPMRQPDDEGLTIRELRSDELGFLKEMLYAALAWRPGVALPPIEWVLAHPQVSVFHADWGRPGDVALVAEEGGHLVGLVWYRLFSEDSHGEGFIDAETPELAIAVADGHRGRGIGRRLMEAAGERARADRIARLSLSVDEGNPARHLYTALGYVEFVADDGLGRMVLDLEPQAG